ncbi:sulfotransferase [Salinimonas sp. HHU 13199]|uniref:Sulfotransferase n=1 Tax=Salinimonas profundi TaxID=2729140 RepID=A0ABR8LNZ8_9ALTE|nr:sulfotransferase [Salinimonas profundi]MBD3586646.1 sulfotransferase [Salinimonas profundi]
MKVSKDFIPVFVVGSARSGTTMMAKLLSSHSSFYEYRAETLILTVCRKRYGDIFGNEEKKLTFLSDWFESRQFERSNLSKEQFIDILNKSTSYPELLVRFLSTMTNNANKHFIVDSTPANVRYVKDILKVYKNAKFIWMVRDGRDVSISQERLGWVNPPFPFRAKSDRLNYTLINWKLINANCINHNNSSIFRIKYEEFLNDPYHYVEQVSEFLGTDPSKYDVASALNPQKSNSAFSDVRKHGVFKPVERWRELDATLVNDFTYGCSNFFKMLEYSVPSSAISFRSFFRYYYFLFHLKAKKTLSDYHIFSRKTTETLEIRRQKKAP